MTRDQLEHLIRAVGDILGVRDVIIIGSQAVLGSFPEGLPSAVTVSVEADLIPFNDDPEAADLISATIGELSRFHEQFGVYGDGVSLATGRFPRGWQDRLVPVDTPGTNGVTGWCAEVHDLAVAKMLAGRPKDYAFTRALVDAGIVDVDVVITRLAQTDSTLAERTRVTTAVRGMERPAP